MILSEDTLMPTPASDTSPVYVEAVLPVPLRRSFTYRIPEKLRPFIKLGARLMLPFGRRDLTGYAVGLHADLPPDVEIDESKIKDVIELTDEEPLVTPEILELTKWTADYYASFWGEMLKASLPAGINTERVKPKRRKSVRLIGSNGSVEGEKPLTDVQSVIINVLTENGGEMLFTDLIERASTNASPIMTLAKRGYLEVYVDDIMRDPLSGAKLPDRDEFDR